jgi:plastocyanin
MLTPAERIGWVIAGCIIAVMAILVFTGPYHNFNKVIAAPKVSHFPPARVQIEKNVKHPNLVGMFVPDPVTVHVGQEVIFTNVSDAPHTVTIPNKFDSQIIDIGHTFTKFPTSKPGTYHYKCTIHPGMVGTLIVKS